MTTLGEPVVITLPEPGVIGLAELMVITLPGLQQMATSAPAVGPQGVRRLGAAATLTGLGYFIA